jgi:IS5 family transposase
MFETNIEELVPSEHKYRRINDLIDFKKLCDGMEKILYSRFGRAGYHPVQGLKMLFLQFYKDLSDRELEEELRDSNSAKWFCGFSLLGKTPDHSYFGTFRTRLGTKHIATIFNKLNKSLKNEGLIREVFTFVDSSKIEAKVDSWKARDKALADSENDEKDDDGNPTMNNSNIKDYSSDSDARYGVKGRNKFWVGYKRHVSVDMHQGFINKVAVTPANVHDGKGFKHVCPRTGAAVADKAYFGGEAKKEMARRQVHSMAIEPNNSKTKNRDKDRFISALRMPFEGVFSKQAKKCCYRSTVKTQFQAFCEAFVHNVKRAFVLEIEPIPIV